MGRLRPREGVDSIPRQKPKMRGIFHQYAALLAVPAVVALWAGTGSSAGKLGAAVFGATLVALFAISAIYHRPNWAPRTRDLVGRMDQAAIFLLIAGTYTPFGLLLRPVGGHLLLAMVWGCALGGVALSLAWPQAPKPLMAGIYVAFAWMFVPFVPSLVHSVGLTAFLLLLMGGLVYTLGAAVYALRRPDPYPRVFGYHEVFHLFVVAGAALHFAAVSLTLPAVA